MSVVREKSELGLVVLGKSIERESLCQLLRDVLVPRRVLLDVYQAGVSVTLLEFVMPPIEVDVEDDDRPVR